MADIRMNDLEKQLRAGKPSRVYFIYGNEALLKKKAVDKLLDSCVPEMMSDFNYQRFDGALVQPSEILDAIMQLPMMAERRCVLVEDYDMVKASAADKEIIKQCIEQAPDFCVLIFWQNDTEASGKNGQIIAMAKLCAKHGSALRLDTPRTSEIAMMIVEQAYNLGAAISKNDAYHLIERCGNDLTILSAELEKLSVYAGKKAITARMIDDICAPSLEADVFKISRSIIRGNNDEAFGITTRLLSQKVEPIEIFMLLCSDFVDLYRAKAASGAGMDDRALIEAFPGEYGGKTGFRATNAMRDQRDFSSVRLKRYIELLYDAEIKMKTAKTDRKACLEQLVARLCAEGSMR